MIYENIKELCEERGITIKELERIVGVGNATIAHWKTSIPNIVTLTKVADYFGVAIDNLIGRENFTQKVEHSRHMD